MSAAVCQCPVFGGDVASFDRSSIAGFPGVIDIVRVPNGIAVVAETYWQARSALDALKVTFSEGPAAAVSTTTLRDDYRRAMDGNECLLIHAEGNPDALHHDYPNLPVSKDVLPLNAGLSAASEIYPTIFSQEYESQFLAHATMEPMNCTARVAGDKVEIWAPTQGQEMTRITLAPIFNLPKENIEVSRTFLGGGFGRRLVADFVCDRTGDTIKVKRHGERDSMGKDTARRGYSLETIHECLHFDQEYPIKPSIVAKHANGATSYGDSYRVPTGLLQRIARFPAKWI